MSKIILTRFYHDEISTCGFIKASNLKTPIFTLELPWVNNKKDISCIPTGKYKIAPFYSDEHKDCLEIYNVVGRDLIRIHSLNSVRSGYRDPFDRKKIWNKESKGCIGVGKKIRFDGIIENSKDALKELLDIVKTEEDFEIIQSY